jgi:glycosyltransferase involved in cell wall biosynthesis
VRVVVLTTSYPRQGAEHAGRFVADAVEHLRAAGIDVDVLAPGRYRDFGLAGPDGILPQLRRRPWAGPLLMGSMTRAARAAARDADLVHAHWLPTATAALLARVPYVVTLHGSDVALARRWPRLARRVLRRAHGVIAVSAALADEARGLGASAVAVIPNGIEIPAEPGADADPPYVLYAGRLAPEKGVEELVTAARGLPLVVAGDGPLRDRVPGALGWVPRPELERLLSGATVVACPSRREGFGIVCAEAMARGRAVVASSVGGLLDLVAHERTGLLVPPGDPAALRAALQRLLDDAPLRQRLGEAARAHVSELCAWDRVTERTIAAYRHAVSAPPGRARGSPR